MRKLVVGETVCGGAADEACDEEGCEDDVLFHCSDVCYEILFAVMVRSSRLVVVVNSLSHWRPKLVQMDFK